ncbi:MAG: tetraacyldisaccharide 4'-kinase [Phycisphaerae bacterium]|jgi:tetraacyldisaccharide 4'-kinase
MSEHSLFRRVIAGESGLWAAPLRGVLRLGELLYAGGVAIRNARYTRSGPKYVAPVPVISVGNLTVGGTGKTPFVIHVVNRLEGMGRNPAVVSRGYGAGNDTENDEERLIRKRCPSVTFVSDPNRALAAETAHRRFGADVIVLDDGFQHRRLGRTMDIVLIDATCPFGYAHLLPRGLLREPLTSLRRAHAVVLTRCDQVSQSQLANIESKVRSVARDAVQLRCSHRVIGVERLDGTPIPEATEGKRAVVFGGIGRPQAFATTVRSLGIDVVGRRWWPDHHHYRRRDVEWLMAIGRFPSHDLLLTTEKDAVKLATLEGIDRTRIGVVRIAIEFADDGDTILKNMLSDVLKQG